MTEGQVFDPRSARPFGLLISCVKNFQEKDHPGTGQIPSFNHWWRERLRLHFLNSRSLNTNEDGIWFTAVGSLLVNDGDGLQAFPYDRHRPEVEPTTGC